MKTDLLRQQIESDEHGPAPNGTKVSAFWCALKRLSNPTKVCLDCKAEYPVEMFKRAHLHTVFYKGNWYVQRESMCLQCEMQRTILRAKVAEAVSGVLP